MKWVKTSWTYSANHKAFSDKKLSLDQSLFKNGNTNLFVPWDYIDVWPVSICAAGAGSTGRVAPDIRLHTATPGYPVRSPLSGLNISVPGNL